jgi:hypothetical protein
LLPLGKTRDVQPVGNCLRYRGTATKRPATAPGSVAALHALTLLFLKRATERFFTHNTIAPMVRGMFLNISLLQKRCLAGSFFKEKRYIIRMAINKTIDQGTLSFIPIMLLT